MTPKYPGMFHITYNELVEFTRRLALRVHFTHAYHPAAEPHIAAVYNEMLREVLPMEGVSAEGASWAMEGVK